MKISVRQRWTWNGCLYWRVLSYNRYKGQSDHSQKYREDLGDTFILSKAPSGLLSLDSSDMDEYGEEFTAKLRELSTTDKESRQFKRFFMSGATECEFDKQGRILVPASLRKYADLQKDVVLTGMDTRIELWSAEKWDVENDMDDEDMEAVAAHMASLGVNI
ncbi:MAG: division/cell wall cluster transcriptional repressor MraZ [Lachnospiraceae bacterium]